MNARERAGAGAPELRVRLIRLLAAELADAWQAALASGATSADLAAVVDGRRRAIQQLRPAGVPADHPDQ